MDASYALFGEVLPHGVPLREMEQAIASDLADPDGVAQILGAESEDGAERVRTDFPRIRPILVALAARASGAGSVDSDTQYLAEVLHVALAVHDAALGRTGGRRRRLARTFARSMRRLGFNHLMLRSIEMTRAVQPGLMDDLLDTLRLFSDSRSVAQDVRRPDVQASLDDWSEHADGHTGALFSFCCRAGAHVAASGPQEARFLARYGRHLGRLWHIAEDVAVLSLPDAGAQLASRAAMGRPSLPLIYAAAERDDIAEDWANLRMTPTDALGEALAEKLRAGAGLSSAREQMLRESWLAQQALGRLPESAYRDQLSRLCVAIARSVWPKAALLPSPEVDAPAH